VASVPADAADRWSDPAGTALIGDPVDVVTGRVTETTLCFRLIGPVVLKWNRHYDTQRCDLQRGFGFGHAHSYDHRLSFDVDGLMLEEPIGRRTGFPTFRRDGEAHTVRGATLRRLSLLSYRLSRPGQPVIDFDFADPEQAARVARVHRLKAEVGFHYTSDGRLVGVVHATGLRITAEEDAAQRLVCLAGAWDGGPNPRPILQCSYDAAGNLVSMVDALNRQTRFVYDSQHRLICRTDRRGYSFLFEYDSKGRCVRAAGEDGVMGVILRYRDDAQITEVTRSDRGVWQYQYDAAGLITQVIGPSGDVRRYVKSGSGRVNGEIDPLGSHLAYVVDHSGSLVGKRCASGRVISVRAGREMAGPPFHRVADRCSQFIFGRLPRRLAVPENGASLPVAAARALHPSPEQMPRSPDVPPFGVLPWYPEPREGREFTPFGHLVRQTLPGGRQRRWTYDPNDSMHIATDADGSVTRQERRSWNQLSAWIDPLGRETRYRFSTEDQVTGVQDPGGTLTEFAYDKERRLLGVRRAGEVRDLYRRDSAGNLVEKRDAADNTLLTLVPTVDRMVAERRLTSGGVHRFTYDATGRFLSAAVDLSEVLFAYDAAGRRTQDKRDGQGVVHDFAAEPDCETTTVFDRFVTTRRWTDDAMTIRMPGGGWIRIDRPARGVMRRLCSNGTSEVCQFDGMGRLIASLVTSERAASRRWLRTWRYSAEGDLLEIGDSRFGITRYRYDAAHRLAAAERGGTTDTFTYDGSGNLVSQPGLSGVEHSSGNRLASANGWRFRYDVRHHVAERSGAGGALRYAYDSCDMLVTVAESGWSWQAEYDALGRRVCARRDGSEHRFFWDADRLAAEVAPSGQLRIYAYADSLALTPLAFVDYPDVEADLEEASVRFVVSDQRGAPVLVDDGIGTVLWEAQIAPYGAAKISTGGLVFNLRFPGHYFDAETGLHYNRFRYYDPLLGRYIQSDPHGIGGGINVYAYPANPLVRVDVRGLTGGSGGACPDETAAPPGEPAENDEQTSEPGGAGRPRLSREEGQRICDAIHGVLDDDPRAFRERTTGLTELDDGRIVITGSEDQHQVSPAQKREAIAQLTAAGFDEDDIMFPNNRRRSEDDYIPPDERRLPDGPNPDRNGDAEQRGIQAGRVYGSPATRQWASSGAGHGGAACEDCETAQQAQDPPVQNETGYQSGGGRYDRGGVDPYAGDDG
jgi:RHS repeat-associated protein